MFLMFKKGYEENQFNLNPPWTSQSNADYNLIKLCRKLALCLQPLAVPHGRSRALAEGAGSLTRERGFPSLRDVTIIIIISFFQA